MPNLKILVVEDEKVLNSAYKTILEKTGHEVSVAFDGNEALEILPQFQPDIILLDLKMPNLDGIGFMRVYKQLDLKKRSKIILFSNFDLQKEIDEAFKLGVDKYVLKAWASPKDLIKIIEDISQ
ncbi:response regulator [Candidatus Saccharibacteria bacterium]|nr:response regulator [Candidatus Saccharibacteria bacterium]